MISLNEALTRCTLAQALAHNKSLIMLAWSIVIKNKHEIHRSHGRKINFQVQYLFHQSRSIIVFASSGFLRCGARRSPKRFQRKNNENQRSKIAQRRDKLGQNGHKIIRKTSMAVSRFLDGLQRPIRKEIYREL